MTEAKSLLKQIRLEIGELDEEFFGRYYFPEYFSDETPSFHLEITSLINHYEANHDKYSGVIFAAPRGHAKSTRISFIKVMHWICFKKKKFVVLISDSGMQAEGLSMDLKLNFEQNEKIKEDFGDLCGDAYGLRWSSGDFYVGHPKEDGSLNDRGKPRLGATCRVVARGTGGSMRGLKSRSSRPDAVILDDAEDDVLVSTAEQRKKTWNWMVSSVIPMLDPKTGSFIVNGTVLHHSSMLANLLKQTDIYLTKKYQALQPDGSALWPERFPVERLARYKKQLGTLKFNQEYMNDPMDDETQLFKSEYFKFYTSSQIHFDFDKEQWMYLDEPLTIFQAVDPAIAERETADDFVIFTIGVTATNKVFCLDVYHAHIDFVSQVKQVVKHYQEWRPELIGIETNAYQVALKQQVIKDALIPVKSIKHNTTSKFIRIQRMTPYFENSQIYIREAMDGEPGFIDQSHLPGTMIHSKMEKFYNQSITYNAKAEHDDILDCLEMALSSAKIHLNISEEYEDFYETEYATHA